MIDIATIISRLTEMQESIKLRGVNANLESLIELNDQKKALQKELESKRHEANKIAKNMVNVASDAREALIQQGKSLNKEIASLQEKMEKAEEELKTEMLKIPNFLAPDTPVGQDDTENVVVRQGPAPREFDFTPKDHVEIGKDLDLIDFESGTKVSGAKFYFLKNEAVLLEQALKLFVMKLAMQQGFTPLITPDLAKKSILIGTGFSPKGEESNIYNVEDLDLSLIATAEITVSGLHSDEILDLDKLPLKYVAESHCFRREAGAAGRETKGLYRVHQFTKVELFQIVAPDQSEAAHEEIVALEEKIYQMLELPYRVVRICAGDLGAPAYKKYDIEVWMPGRESAEKYGEVTSASNCTDFQSRRLQIRCRDKNNNKVFPHMLNGTAIALSRTLIAILENYQQKDGSVMIPKVLQDYIGMERITRK